jgi:hypothetical protein
MRRPTGALILAILTFLQGAYAIFVTLVFLGIVGWTFLGRTVSFSEPQWGQAILSGVMALIYFYVSYGFWTVRIWAWIYGLLVSGFNLVYLLFAVVGPDVTLEAVLVPVILNLLIFGYLYQPGTREAFTDVEIARTEVLPDAGPAPAAPAPAPAAPAPTAAAPASASDAPSDTTGSSTAS